MEKRYSKLELLSRNPDTYTKVKTCYDNLDRTIKVMKIFSKPILASKKRYFNACDGMSSFSLLEDAYSELNILQSLSHPNVLSRLDVVVTETKLKLIFARHKCKLMEEAGSGAFKPLTTIDAIQVATEISSALQYLHSQSICHRDVKPGNILVSYTDRFVLSDFGSARRTRGLIRESPATLAFACPEATIESTGFFDALKADLWALGLVVWCCLFNRFPFEITDDPLTQIKNIQSWDFASDSRISTLDEEKRAVVAALLTRDPISRRYWPS